MASSSPASRRPSQRSLRGLDALNFFLADICDGFGPYLAIYLLAVRGPEHAGVPDVGPDRWNRFRPVSPIHARNKTICAANSSPTRPRFIRLRDIDALPPPGVWS